MEAIWNEFVNAIAARDPSHFPFVVMALTATGVAIWRLKGRAWAYIYVALIPFLNWTFGRPEVPKVDLTPFFGIIFGSEHEIIFNPLTIATGMVFVVRDFVQREMGQKVLFLMAFAVGWSFYYSLPAIALASGIAFAISETSDWVLFTFTKYRLSTRILLSSALAAPIDTTVFLFGADLAQQGQGHPPGEMFNLANWVFFIIGKMIGAVVVAWMIRRREDRGEVNPAAA
jgi:hypothetical protein